MNKDLIAKASTIINAPVQRVWNALVSPELIKQYFFGVDVVSDWQVGSSIVWKGEWEGKSFEDKGEILKMEDSRVLEFSHYSPLAGKPDVPENYHTVTIELSGDDDQTVVALSQDNNETEEARKHSEKNWNMVLSGLKALLET